MWKYLEIKGYKFTWIAGDHIYQYVEKDKELPNLFMYSSNNDTYYFGKVYLKTMEFLPQEMPFKLPDLISSAKCIKDFNELIEDKDKPFKEKKEVNNVRARINKNREKNYL